MKEKQPNRYQALVAEIFKKSYKKGTTFVTFSREELIETADRLGIKIPNSILVRATQVIE